MWVDTRNHESGAATDIYGRDITTRTSFVVARNATVKWYPEIVDDWVDLGRGRRRRRAVPHQGA